jgi:hypothetical protein
MGNFVRVRVRLDVRKVLARFVTISREGQREFYQVQYEKIPRFCGACGYFGHSHLECGSGEHDEEKLKWGDFLKADWETWFGRGLGFGRGGGRGSGRAGRAGDGAGSGRGRDPGGRGRAMLTPWRHNALHNSATKSNEDELDDTASSPGKSQDMELDKRDLANPNAKRSLALNEDEIDVDNLTKEEDITNQGVALLTDGKPPAVSLDGEDGKDRKKRTKKDGANSSSLGSAGSREDLVRPQ